jgi:hypothetical protein
MKKSEFGLMARRELPAQLQLWAGGALNFSQVRKFLTFGRSLVRVEPAIAFDRCCLVGCRSMLVVDSG